MEGEGVWREWFFFREGCAHSLLRDVGNESQVTRDAAPLGAEQALSPFLRAGSRAAVRLADMTAACVFPPSSPLELSGWRRGSK